MITLNDQEATVTVRSLLTLPDDILYVIFSYCSVSTLGKLAATCRHIGRLIIHDSVWKRHMKNKTAICSMSNSKHMRRYTLREQYHLANNWQEPFCSQSRLVHHAIKQMPCIQLHNQLLYASYKNVIRCYRQKNNGRLSEITNRLMHVDKDDVTQFKCKNDRLVASSRDGGLFIFNTSTGFCHHMPSAHNAYIHSVDFHDSTIISGSRDSTVKIWNSDDLSNPLKHEIDALERVWSVALSPNPESFVVGSSGLNNVSPLRMYHTESGRYLGAVGQDYRYGAGVLDLQYDSPNILFSCGYDTFVRMWDLRNSNAQCVAKWEDPFDSTIYCVRSDGRNAFVSGTARHGLVRLWDKRMTQHVQLYYCGRVSSPVYSIAFDPAHLYVALDKGINMLDFGRHV